MINKSVDTVEFHYGANHAYGSWVMAYHPDAGFSDRVYYPN